MRTIQYNDEITPRRVKQLIMSVVFLLILVGIWLNPLFGFALPVCMIAGIGIGFFYGRKWCDWACPRGSFYEECLARVSLKRPIPGLIDDIRFKITVLALLFGVFGYFTYIYRGSPLALGRAYGFILTITTMIGILLGLYFRPRVWCNFCPVGSIAGWLGSANKKRNISGSEFK